MLSSANQVLCPCTVELRPYRQAESTLEPLDGEVETFYHTVKKQTQRAAIQNMVLTTVKRESQELKRRLTELRT